MLINKTHAHRKVARVAPVWGKRAGVLNSEQLGWICHVHFSLLRQDHSCVSCSWAATGNQMLHVSLSYASQRDNTSRIKALPQTIRNFWLWQVWLKDSSSKDQSLQILPLEKGISFWTSKVRLSSQFMFCWVESVRIQIKVHIFQWQGGNGYVNTRVLTSICIKLCKHIHLLRSAHRSSSLGRALLKHCSNLFGSRLIIQVLCSEPEGIQQPLHAVWGLFL